MDITRSELEIIQRYLDLAEDEMSSSYEYSEYRSLVVNALRCVEQILKRNGWEPNDSR